LIGRYQQFIPNGTWNMEAEIVLLGPREMLEPASESIIFLQNKKKCRPSGILLHSRRLYLQQFGREDATSHIMYFSVLCLA
jgi:hypothetical protein